MDLYAQTGIQTVVMVLNSEPGYPRRPREGPARAVQAQAGLTQIHAPVAIFRPPAGT